MKKFLLLASSALLFAACQAPADSNTDDALDAGTDSSDGAMMSESMDSSAGMMEDDSAMQAE